MSRQEVYKSKAWKTTRKYIWIKQHCLCNRCGQPVYVDGITPWIPKDKRIKGIVHHKEYLNEINYTDDRIAYDEDNLEGLCIDCHNKEHFSSDSTKPGLTFDEFGNLVQYPPGRKQ